MFLRENGVARGPLGGKTEVGGERNSRLTRGGKLGTVNLPLVALIVYRLGQEILNLQSGVRFPVGAPSSEETEIGQTDVRQIRPK